MRAGAVVVVPGLGSTPAEWAAVVAGLPAAVPVHVVDPARAPRLRSRAQWRPDAVAARLAQGLAGTPGPLLLVGHSSGALHVQALLDACPARCAGAVLVDGSHARTVRLAPWPLSAVGRWIAEGVVATGLVARAGPWLRRFAVGAASVRGRNPVPPAHVREVYGARTWPETTLDAWFGHGPLQAGVLARQAARDTAGRPMRLVAGTAGRGGASWAALQRDLAHRLGAPPPLLLADAAHLVHLDRPDAVVATVGELLRS